jgi:hypothetical protein
MPVLNGNDVVVKVGGTTIGCLTGCSYSSTQTEIDVTCKDDSGNRAILTSGLTGNVTFNGFFKPDATYGVEDLLDIHLAGTEVSLAFGDAVNLTIYSQARLTEFTWDGPLNAGSTFSGKFSLSGTPVKTES